MSRGEHVSRPGDTASLRHSAAPTERLGTPTLVAFAGRAEPAVRPISQAITIGRDAGCDVVLDDATASRAHTRLAPADGGVEIVDLASHNGTYADGRPIQRVSLGGPCILRVGETLFRLLWSGEPWSVSEPQGPLVGGTSLAAVRRQVRLVGPTDLPVLVLGETGTGKEVLARLLHETSGRSGPFIAVNCAALPESLVESELFGHVRGAFTGATTRRKGLFAAASGGTLFLDEVGDVPASAQAKLLRVLEDGLVRPVGGEKNERVDVRVLSATNRDLTTAVSEKRFRADLLARLAAVEVHIPPLRERPEDLPALGAYLLQRAGVGPLPIEPDALEAMALYHWPMNVRELDNALRIAALTGADRIGYAQLPEPVRNAARPGTSGSAPPRPRAGDVREQLEAALREHHGNVRRASQAMGLARSHIYRLLKRYELDPNAYRPSKGRHEDCSDHLQTGGDR